MLFAAALGFAGRRDFAVGSLADDGEGVVREGQLKVRHAGGRRDAEAIREIHPAARREALAHMQPVIAVRRGLEAQREVRQFARRGLGAGEGFVVEARDCEDRRE